jgi:hypothetical protein
LWGTLGEDALQCLLALRVEVPNEAHLLAALHLIRGGMHVTLNFDVGIELAYELLTGRAALLAAAPAEYGPDTDYRLFGRRPRRLRTAACRRRDTRLGVELLSARRQLTSTRRRRCAWD